MFEIGGIVFMNYRGTDDGQGGGIDDVVTPLVGIAPDEARFFFTSDDPETMARLYSESFASADFMDTVNIKGLPRYARMHLDERFQKFVELHTEQNPLPLCLRPQTLVRGIVSDDSE
jgi:hypothetical protein